MKRINIDNDLKDVLWFLIYPIITWIWLLCLTGTKFNCSREPDIINNEYTVETSSVIIKEPIKIIHDTIWM